MSEEKPLLHLEGLSKVFYTEEVETHALAKIDLSIKEVSVRDWRAWRRVGMAVLLATSMAPYAIVGQTERMVPVDGLEMHVVTQGLDSRSPDEAVIVFESGAGSPLERWNPLLRLVADFAPVIAYDRSAVGSTPWDGLQVTPEHVIEQLQRLLTRLGVAPPYVLVGHSWGSVLISHFALAYPEQVVGIVHIDSTPFRWRRDDEKAILESLAPGGGWVEWYEAREVGRQARRAALPPARRALVTGNEEYLAEAPVPPIPDVPTSVVKAARRVRANPCVSPPGQPFDMCAYGDAISEDRESRLRGWVRLGGEFVVATTTAHFVHADEPEMVADVIRRMALEKRLR